MMSDKEIVVFLVLVREQLDKGSYDMVRAIINEKIKRLGFKLTGQLILDNEKNEKEGS